MHEHRTSTVKVGLLSLISIALLILVMVWLRGRGVLTGETHMVRFKDVDGMRIGAPVQMMGIRIGFVDEVDPEVKDSDYYVNVKFTITDPDIVPPKGSKLSIEQSGLIGEKFLEITPPQVQEVTLTTFQAPAKALHSGIPVKFLYEEGLLTVGHVIKVSQSTDDQLVKLKLSYKITMPGAMVPEHPVFELAMDGNSEYHLRILPRESIIAKAPDKNLIFTIENPIRMKEFLEIQMESAEALALTNDKITKLLSDETIATMSSTIKNTEVLTARATDVLDSADDLMNVAGDDLRKLVVTSERLAQNLIIISDNVNGLIGDPQVADDIKTTVAAIRQSTETLNDLIQDPALKDTLNLAHQTTEDASELVHVLRNAAGNDELHMRLDTSLTLLNESLVKLSGILTSVEEATNDEDESLKQVITDVKETAENLREFSEKMNGRFTLFKLMF